MQTKESFLKGRTTGFLLRQVRGKYCQHWPDEIVSLWDANTRQNFYYTKAELKAELDRRPHLPNKLERSKPKKKLSKSKTTEQERKQERSNKAYERFKERWKKGWKILIDSKH